MSRVIEIYSTHTFTLPTSQLAREMMTSARQAGALVTLDLASFELVRNCKEALMGLLQVGTDAGVWAVLKTVICESGQ